MKRPRAPATASTGSRTTRTSPPWRAGRLRGPGHQLGVGRVAVGARGRDRHAREGPDHHQRHAAVVAVTEPRHPQAGEVAEALAQGLGVGQRLAGVVGVGEPVDDRHAGVPVELHQRLVGAGAQHDRVHHAAEHLGGVLDRLSPAQLHVVGREHEAGAAEAGDAAHERDPRAGGRALEDQGDHASVEQCRPSIGALALEPVGRVEDRRDRLGRVVPQGQQRAPGQRRVGDEGVPGHGGAV